MPKSGLNHGAGISEDDQKMEDLHSRHSYSQDTLLLVAGQFGQQQTVRARPYRDRKIRDVKDA
ncbi:uncharacterized protein PgNI_01214 [Pyricularia grisea]|uniref:Uncharacterized protein n=1 Tax=Pyricularia grisea TaxID=148305 RepID=A0A6P8BGK4_PYRGI|nr:uncharacterized protein PgNI_01214 [Pyricularia grisea]TLD15913.1 hypothetical protein PgNI_01214 [Pyricularia grisea]